MIKKYIQRKRQEQAQADIESSIKAIVFETGKLPYECQAIVVEKIVEGLRSRMTELSKEQTEVEKAIETLKF